MGLIGTKYRYYKTKEMCSFVAHPCLVWEKQTVVTLVAKTFPRRDAQTKTHILLNIQRRMNRRCKPETQWC